MVAATDSVSNSPASVADQMACGVDQSDRRPGVHVVRAPDAEVPVVDDRMPDAQAIGGCGDPIGLTLARELAGVDADHGEGVGKPLVQLPDTREHVHAVDSTVRPEVQEHHSTSEHPEIERAEGVDPIEPGLQLGRVDVSNQLHVFGSMRGVHTQGGMFPEEKQRAKELA